METRNIQGIGGSSFSVTLPKKWVTGQKLKDKDPVRIFQQKSGALQIWPKTVKHARRKTVSIQDVDGDNLYREMIVLYILGYEEIELKAGPITLAQRKTVRAAMQKLVGMETIEESSEYIYLRSFLDPEKFSFKEYMGKIFLMTRLMFTDAVNAFLRHNMDLAADVVDRDFEVDKIDFLISRMKHSLMLGRISEEELNSSLEEADYYESIAKQLERVADHAVKIAKLTQADPAAAGQKLAKALQEASEKIVAQLQEAQQFTQSVDKKLANQVLLRLYSLPPHAGSYQEIIKTGYAPALIINDSFDRITGYIINMAEYTLAQAMI